MLTNLLKAILPGPPLNLLKKIKFTVLRMLDSFRTPEKIFTDIYRKNLWGGTSPELYSGLGSRLDEIVLPYIQSVIKTIKQSGIDNPQIVDLGCGDFYVSRFLIEHCSKFIGTDVVKEIIESNRAKFSANNVEFMHLDITKDDLPDADICIVRQVLQHLTNKQIIMVISKLPKYKLIIITEHYPPDNPLIKPNIDKTHGADIRLQYNSGVYLDQPPYNIPSDALTLLLEVKINPIGTIDPGVIRTFLLKGESVSIGR
ncbi:MAG: class I SAM-dependent methyltransferase [Syntrophobacteraceae bacterium]|jgi:SAM-dependent methyltransferase